MITINKYLDNILLEFKEYATSGVELCQLKKVHFDGGRLPDYSDIHIEQLYLLRYAYAYGFEYKQMYKSLWHRVKNLHALRVTSIGCGSMIDYWALTQIVPENCNIRYTGIDTIDWFYRFEPRPQDSISFVKNDVVSLFASADALTSDVYIFPKSISEFSHDDIRIIGNSLSKKLPSGQTVYLLFSLRTDEWNLAQDMSKTKIIFDAMVESGYKTSDLSNGVAVLNRDYQEKKIREVDSSFLHPQNVVKFLREDLHECCIKYVENWEHCKSDCERRLSWWPILTCQQAKWQLFEFTKEE